MASQTDKKELYDPKDCMPATVSLRKQAFIYIN